MMQRSLQPRAPNSPMRLYPRVRSSFLAVQVLWLLLAAPPLQAQTFTVLHTFTGKGDGDGPVAGVTRDSVGNLYGTTQIGGSFDIGTVFEINAHDKETILHNFWGGDGVLPSGPLLRDHTGTLYGTTLVGGTPEGGDATTDAGRYSNWTRAARKLCCMPLTAKRKANIRQASWLGTSWATSTA
jgi:uncharacterized repeat protein (TIGR03803 family)